MLNSRFFPSCIPVLRMLFTDSGKRHSPGCAVQHLSDRVLCKHRPTDCEAGIQVQPVTAEVVNAQFERDFWDSFQKFVMN